MTGTASPRVRTVLVGFGRVNRAIHAAAESRPWLEIVGVVVRPGAISTGSVPEVPGPDRERLIIDDDAERVLADAQPDVVIIATRPRVAEVMSQIRTAAARARLVLCTAEELAYTAPDDADTTSLQAIALEHSSAIVPVGVNPGYLFDRLPVALAALATRVERVTVRRLVDASAFPERARAHLGLGLAAADFARGVADGSIAGHLGFTQSCRTISSAMGVELVPEAVAIRPLLAQGEIALGGTTIAPGAVAGIEQQVRAAGRDRAGLIELSLTFHLAPTSHGLEAQDEILIAGAEQIRLVVPGGVRPGPATAALAINSIGVGLRAGPGYHPAGSLDLPSAWLGLAAPR